MEPACTCDAYVALWQAYQQSEREFSSAIAEWRAQLQSRTEELETLKLELKPQDIAMMRIEMMEQLEGPHRSELAAAWAGAERHQALHLDLRRHFEDSLCRVRVRI